MRVIEVSIGSGRTVPHPSRPGENYKPSCFLKARLEPGDDHFTIAGQLQADADSIVEMHVDGLLERTEVDPIVGDVTPQEKLFVRELVAAVRDREVKDRAEGCK